MAALHGLQVLDTAPEPAFDALVQLAAAACGAPMSLLSLVDEQRQWFKANHGLEGVTQTPRDVAFCAHAVLGPALMQVTDATQDPRFAENPLVLGDPQIRFYAGAPLQLAGGQRVGTLCVIDRVPRELNATQQQTLQNLALVATQLLEARRSALELRRAALELATSEARFRSLSEGSPLGVFATDAQGHCTYTNPRWLGIYGLSAQQALGEGWVRSLHPLDRDAVFSHWQATAQQGRDFELDFRILRPDQSVCHVRSHARPVRGDGGVVVGHIGSVEDITPRKQLEAFLDRTGRLANVDGWELDLRTQVLTWSQQTRAIHEVDSQYIPTLEGGIAFYAPAGQALITAGVQAGVAHGRPWDIELPLITAKGREIWVRGMGEAEFESGQPVRLVGALQDITDQRSRLQALGEERTLRTALQAEMAHTQRLLQERSEMLDVMAHEIRQPLNNASAALQSAVRALPAADEKKASPRLVRAQGVLAHVLASIDNTLAVAALLARPDPIERVDTDLDMLLNVAVADLPPAQRHRVCIERNTATRTASMDMSLMRLALRNLLANALRYSPGPGKVVLRLSDSDNPLALLLDVQDEGPGMPADRLPRLFERAVHHGLPRGSVPGGQGMGLGLYIVRRVMELHHGSAVLLSNGPQGVTMRLTLHPPLD